MAISLLPFVTHLLGLAKSLPDFFDGSSGASIRTWSSVICTAAISIRKIEEVK
jgi:hypothetical protein